MHSKILIESTIVNDTDIDYQSGSELGDSNSDQQAPETQAETGICESDGSPPPKRPALEPSNLGQCVDDEIAHYANGSVSLNTETRFNLESMIDDYL